MTSNIKIVDMNEEAKQETNNETVEPIQEEPNSEPVIENSVEPTEEVTNTYLGYRPKCKIIILLFILSQTMSKDQMNNHQEGSIHVNNMG